MTETIERVSIRECLEELDIPLRPGLDAWVEALETVEARTGADLCVIDGNYDTRPMSGWLERVPEDCVGIVFRGATIQASWSVSRIPWSCMPVDGSSAIPQLDHLPRGEEYATSTMMLWRGDRGAAPPVIGELAPRLVLIGTPEWPYSTSEFIAEKLCPQVELAQADDFDQQVRKQQVQRVIDGLSDTVSRRNTETARVLRRDVSNYVAEVQSHTQRRLEAERRLEDLSRQLAAIDYSAEDVDARAERFEQDAHRLAEHSLIESIGAEQDRLNVVTKPLTMSFDHQGEQGEAEAGVFHIVIDLVEVKMTITNQTRRIGSYDHPHISNGNFCMGEMLSTVSQLIERVEIFGAVNMVLALLQQVNPGDVYTSEWHAWFELDDSEDN